MAVTGSAIRSVSGRRERRFALLLFAPAFIALIVSTTAPLVYLAWTSLMRIDLSMPYLSGFAGVDNYAKMGGDPRFWNSLWLTLVYTASTVVLQVVLGLSLALLVLRIPRGQAALRIAAILPIVLAPVVVGLFWRTLVLTPDVGLVDLATRALGLGSHNWLGDPQLALISVIAIHTWQWTPFAFLVLLASLSALPPDVFEAARIDRASAWQRFRHITLPLIRPAIVIVVIMVAVRTTLTAKELPHSLAKIRSRIERDVPVGFDAHPRPFLETEAGDRAAALRARMQVLHERYRTLDAVRDLGRMDAARVWNQLGTLGGGNHFIEICLDELDRVWVMLHSGSRNIGNRIGEAAIATARRLAERDDVHLPDRDLAWLSEGSVEFDRYVNGLRWAQDYAALNRDLMLFVVLEALAHFFARPIAAAESAVNCHHNYAAVEEHFGRRLWITRKGAVSARRDELGIIPGSMNGASVEVVD